MKKPIIGIASLSTYKANDNIFDDRYYILNNYINPIIKNGGIPIGLIYHNEKLITESLSICDAFIIPGGSKIIKAHLQIIDYAINHNKPLLGICMGMQALAMYSLYGVNAMPYEMKVLKLITNGTHDAENPDRGYKAKKSHFINIDRTSRLFSILKKDKLKVNSFHKYQINSLGDDFKINSMSTDGVVEGIEIIDKTKLVIGLQFHPELLPNMNELFGKFIKECQKY